MQGLWLALIAMFGSLALGYSISYALLSKPVKAHSGSLRQCKFFSAVIGWAVLWVIISWLIKPLYFETYIAYVSTLYRLHIFFTIMLVYVLWRLGVHSFQEENLKERFVAAAIIVAGVLLIASENLPEQLTHKIELFGL